MDWNDGCIGWEHQLGTELELGTVVERLAAFLMPVSAAASRGEQFTEWWDGEWGSYSEAERLGAASIERSIP